MRLSERNTIQRLALCMALFFSISYSAQEQPWQQEVKYRMDVSLDDSLHTLTGFSTITYKNNSTSQHKFLYFHLWPNAYRNRNTALARQKLHGGDKTLYYAKESELGFIDSLDFRVNSEPLKWELDNEHIDICTLWLNEPLAPGDSVVITTPFFVKIPDAKFSRLGHTRQAYFITQWYPKPAVFDEEGWHPMPYLDQGEFYSEFGSFDVRITLPSNYVLAATGDRINAPEEVDFLKRRISETAELLDNYKKGQEVSNSFPPSSPTRKTVRFVQSNVHDFAWFADKRFRVTSSFVRFETGRVVNTYAFFTPGNTELWKDAVNYINDAVRFYSEHVGEYPYRHATAVDGTIMAGGGMEYPNITVIGNSGSGIELDMVITHEVGHNWFYGMLGSNERRYPFLDEGLNSFYELRYMRQKYPHKTVAALLGVDSGTGVMGLNRLPFWKYHSLSYMLSQRLRSEQAADLPAAEYTSLNYGSIIYSRTAVVLDYLMQTAGKEKFDKAMQDYFSRYRFRHPQPSDFEDVLVAHEIAGREVIRDLFHSTKTIDYKIAGLKKEGDATHEVKIKNRGEINAPFVLSTIKNDSVIAEQVIPGFVGSKVFTLTVAADRFTIDHEARMPEINRENNSIRTRGLFKTMRPVRVQLVSGFEDPGKRQLFVLPFIGGNHYNGFLLGAAFHNYSVYQKKFEWFVAPAFGFRSVSPAGAADAEYKLFSDGIFAQYNLGLSFKSFAFNDRSFLAPGGDFAHYYRFMPYLDIKLRKKPLSHFYQRIVLQHHHLRADSTASEAWNPFVALSSWNVTELKYVFRNSRVLSPFKGELSVQNAGGMTKTFFALDYQADISRRSNVLFRVFGGYFLSGNRGARSFYAFRASGYSGYHDYTLSRYFFARNEREGLGFSQMAEEDGNLKVWTPLGQSTTWMAGLNVKSPKLLRLPLRLFADVVICDPFFLQNDPMLWDAGVNLTLIKDIVEVYYAVIYSDDIGRALDLNNVSQLNRIRFTFNIDKLVPKRLIREMSF